MAGPGSLPRRELFLHGFGGSADGERDGREETDAEKLEGFHGVNVPLFAPIGSTQTDPRKDACRTRRDAVNVGNMIVTTAELYRVAYGKFAIGAYNINNAEQTMGLFKGAIASQSPFIIQLSKGARAYTEKRMLEGIIRSAGEIFPEAIFAVHLDHGDEATCYDCIDSGF